MRGCRHHDFLVEFELGVKPSGKESAFCAQHQAARVERMLDCTVRGSLGDGPELRCRGILPFGQTVYLVIEQDDVYVDIPSYGMDEVVSADGEGVPVTAGLPDRKGRVGDLYPRGNGRSPSVNAVESVCVHVVRQSGRTSDSGHHYIALLFIP